MADEPSEKPKSRQGGYARSFENAWRGVVAMIRTQRNARIHLAATVAVIVMGFLDNLTEVAWSVLFLAMGLVWLAEGMNTAIELLADRVCPEHDERIGRIKDIAAGAVLLASIAAAAVGIIVFL